MTILKFIELSKWFNRKSQHYILGNWSRYVPLINMTNENFFNWVKIDYYRRYPMAWLKFMKYSWEDKNRRTK